MLPRFCATAMCERLIGFDSELKSWILDRVGPFLRDLWIEMSVKRRIDVTCIEIPRQICQLGCRSTHISLHRARVHVALPVRVGVPGCSNKHLRTCVFRPLHAYWMLQGGLI